MLQFTGCVHPSILGLSSTKICPYGLGVKRKCTSESQDQRILAVIITHATPKVIEWSWMLSLLGKTCQDPPVWLDLSKMRVSFYRLGNTGNTLSKKHELSFDVFVQIRFELTYYMFDMLRCRTSPLFPKYSCLDRGCHSYSTVAHAGVQIWCNKGILMEHCMSAFEMTGRNYVKFQEKNKKWAPMNMTESYCVALNQLRESNALNLRIWPVV